MSTYQKKLYVYEGLPSGGAKELYKSNLQFLNKVTHVKEIHENLKPKNIFQYLFLAIFHRTHKLNKTQEVFSKHDTLLAYHSWVTKSPNIIRYFPGKIIYICQEVPREFYDPEHINLQDSYDKLINIIRLLIKWNDQLNIFKAKKRLTVIANSKYELKLINSAYNLSSILLYPGISKSKFDKQVVKKKHQVICVGAINKYKNQLFYINVLSLIDKENRPEILLIGNGFDPDYVKRIREVAKNKKVIVRIKINVSEKELMHDYAESKIFVYAPISEPFGVVVLEAMMAGLPIVSANNGGGYTEVLSHKNGAILGRDEVLWANKINMLLSNKKELEKIRKENISQVKKFSGSRMNNKLWKIIQGS